MASSKRQVGILGQSKVGMKISFVCMVFVVHEFICIEVVSGISDEKKKNSNKPVSMYPPNFCQCRALARVWVNMSTRGSRVEI